MTDARHLPHLDLPLEAIRAFCERHHIQRLGLFGSVLRDDFRPAGDDPSDIDVLVEFEPGHTPGWEIVTIHDELTALLGRRIDLVLPDSLKPAIRARVLPEAVTIYER
ncbi:MAG: nucleotidyltransferase family protein [Candidatus Flexifilum sp.]|jgi:predicted nucleotidyltransferase